MQRMKETELREKLRQDQEKLLAESQWTRRSLLSSARFLYFSFLFFSFLFFSFLSFFLSFFLASTLGAGFKPSVFLLALFLWPFHFSSFSHFFFRVIEEEGIGASEMVSVSGRMSFGNFNPSLEVFSLSFPFFPCFLWASTLSF